MTAREIYDFATSQTEWYTKQIAWLRNEIEFCNRQLKRCRKEDRELCEYVLSHNPSDFDLRIFGKNYVGTETRKYINERARWYRDVKRYEKYVTHYRKEAEEMEKYIG